MKDSKTQVTIHERTPLLANPAVDPNTAEVVTYESIGEDIESPSDVSETAEGQTQEYEFKFLGILALLLIGVFIANADTSLVLATYGEISSEFKSLENAAWLLSSYMLAMCGSQPLYGKLSNIYGRKLMLLASYVLFGAGCLVCGVANNMSTVIAGRLVSGAGGAGMSSVVSFLIADLVPVRDVATYRSYINIVQTVGRSCGGPIGGWLAEHMGWRWSFLIQCPLTLLAIILVGWRLHVPHPVFKIDEENETQRGKLRRIDFLGAAVMVAMIVAFLLPVSMGGNQVPWSHPVIPSLFGGGAVLALFFAFIELRVAREPIFPLTLLTRRDIVVPYIILFLQNIAQTFMMFCVPLYFQVTKSASPSEAGFYLVPAVVGNTVGGLVTGSYIKRTGRYKLPTLLASVIAGFCHLMVSVRWRGHTSIWEALYIFPGGVGTGIANSSTFIAITAATTDEELAIAGSGLYLCGSFGSLLGVTLSSTVLRMVTAIVARSKLPDHRHVVDRALEDVRYIDGLQGKLRDVIVNAYVTGSRANFGLALIACVVCLIIGSAIRERRL